MEVWKAKEYGFKDCKDCLLSPKNCPDEKRSCASETGLCDFFEPCERPTKLIIPRMAGHLASFHGEMWLECPECRKQFEFYDAYFERKGFKNLAPNIFKCECGCYICH